MRLPMLPALSVISLLVIAAAIATLWLLGTTLVIIFVAVLLAAVIDALVRAMRLIIPGPRAISFTLVCLLLLVGAGLLIYYGGPTIVEQINMLLDLLEDQRETFQDLLVSLGGVDPVAAEESTIPVWLPSIDSLFTTAGTAFGMTLGIVGNILVVLFLGIFLASDPGGYRDSVIRLFPVHHRDRLAEVADMAGTKLRWWLVSQLALMVLIGTAVGVMLFALGVPNALLLGIITGSLNFIPYLGPILAALPVFFAVIGEEPVIFVSAMALYFVIQNIEGYVIAPLVQERVVKLPPAWSMLTLTFMGTMFGALGIAVAIPLFAVGRILVRELYIKDVLEREDAVTFAEPRT